MILAPRKYLFATNIVFFCVIFIIQKFIQIFCIIEEKACKNANCTPENRCEERCITPSPPASPQPKVKGLKLIPVTLRKTMRNFGYGEGHYQIFVEEKQRKHHRLAAAVVEVKLNPN